MTNSQSRSGLTLSVLGCIGLVSLLLVAGEVSAQNQNATVDTQWVWVDLPDSIVTGDLASQPGGQSRSWSHDGWVSYGQKANAAECKQTCGADKNCWAFTWHGPDSSWSGFCYGRAPNTVRLLPAVFENPNTGDFSAYKSFDGKSFPNSFIYGPTNKQHWLPETSFEQLAGVNLFAGGFSSPTTKDKDMVKGDMYIGETPAWGLGGTVTARSGAVNIGVTFTKDMCSAAADYMIHLDMIAGSPSIIGNYYTWFIGADDWTHLCLIGSQPIGRSDSRAATSGKRTGELPDIAVLPYYPE